MVDLPEAPSGYANVRLLGTGGFGEVVLARHLALDRVVAIKYLRASAMADPEALQRFRREAVVLAALEESTVVRVHDVRLGEGSPSIIMEYVPGHPLDELLERGALTLDERLAVLADVAHALEAARAKRIVHRDVKPANVFVLPDGRAKLGDFGLARISGAAEVFRTAMDSIGGTPAYLPPEAATGDSEPDGRSDVYSLTVMAYEMLVGRLPFVGLGIMGLVAAHAQTQPPAPDSLVPGFPVAASDALLAGLSKDPAARPSAGELVGRLRAVPPQAWPSSTFAATPAAAPQDSTRHLARATAGASTGAPPERRARRRWPWVVGVAVLAGAAAATSLALTGGDTSDPALAVTGVRVDGPTEPARCPRADLRFVALVSTNGSAGRLRLQWLRPDGKLTAEQVVAVAKGQRSTSVELGFTVTGTRPLAGSATLRILEPGTRSAASAPVAYTCSGG